MSSVFTATDLYGSRELVAEVVDGGLEIYVEDSEKAMWVNLSRDDTERFLNWAKEVTP